MKNRWSFAVGFPRKDRFRRCTFCTRGSVRTACHVNGNGFNNYFYNVSEYTATLGPSRFAGLQLPFHTTPWHRVLGCLALTRNCADSRANSLKLPLRSLQTHTHAYMRTRARFLSNFHLSRLSFRPFTRKLYFHLIEAPLFLSSQRDSASVLFFVNAGITESRSICNFSRTILRVRCIFRNFEFPKF